MSELQVPLAVRPQMVLLICENLTMPGTARILIDFNTGGFSDPTAVVSLPSTTIQDWQDQPVATKRILLRSETAGVIFNDSPWLRIIISDANAESEQATYNWTDNGVTTLKPVDEEGSLYVNRAVTNNVNGYNPHTNNLFSPVLESGQRTVWIDAVATNTTPTTLVLGAPVAATSASIGAAFTVNRYDEGELTYVTSVVIAGAGAIGPFTVNITIPDDYWVVTTGFENAVIVGGFTVTQSWNCGTWRHLPSEKFWELTQRYGRGEIRMLAHAFLVKCGVPELYDQGYITVARLENPLDWYNLILSGQTGSLENRLMSYGNRKLVYNGRFADGLHFFQLPNDKDWDQLREYIWMDPIGSNVMDLAYRREKTYWSPMMWCIKAQNPEGNTTLTPCNCVIEEDQSLAYTTSNPDDTEVSPATANETLTALDTLKKMSTARLLSPSYDDAGNRMYDGEFEELTRNRKDARLAGTNGKHLSRIFKIIADGMSSLSPMKQMGVKYISHALSDYIGSDASNYVGAGIDNIYRALESGLRKRAAEA